MPAPSVLSVLRVNHATTAASTAAATFGVARSVARPCASTTIGTMSAVSIAAGTYRSARASSGGIARRAKNAMNDRRDA